MDMIRSLLSPAARPRASTCPSSSPRPTLIAARSAAADYSLRMCATCGHVGCCESQAGDAEAHWRSTGHEVMLSMPVGRGFTWCYEDHKYI